jgi:hypothetical protein
MKRNTIAEIAKFYLGFETLATRRSDSLDFRDCSVWGVEAALQAAYELGRNSYAADLARHAEVDAAAALVVGSHFDYVNQAWTVDGLYVACGHPASDPCGCFGKLHAGQAAKLENLPTAVRP